jgi:hypothetical protein
MYFSAQVVPRFAASYDRHGYGQTLMFVPANFHHLYLRVPRNRPSADNIGVSPSQGP